MKFERGLDPKDATSIGKNEVVNKWFDDNLEKLKELFSTLKPNEIAGMRNLYNSSESCWDTNLKRFNDKPIKYLLICEAPPASGKYFYCDTNNNLFKQVWRCFFGSQPICDNHNDAYQCLADIGFLLVDTLPYCMDYSKNKIRNKPAYLNLIKSYLPIWVNTLNSNFSFAPDLRIAFGFKLNALAVISASSGSITLGGIPRTLSQIMIAATGAGHPSYKKLARIFGVKVGAFKCSNCP